MTESYAAAQPKKKKKKNRAYRLNALRDRDSSRLRVSVMAEINVLLEKRKIKLATS